MQRFANVISLREMCNDSAFAVLRLRLSKEWKIWQVGKRAGTHLFRR